MRTNLLLLQSAAVLALISACDTRADEKYTGDSLLHLEGRVVLEDDDGSELMPALVFGVQGGGYQVVDVEAKGSFPNNFQIEVFSPPPMDARIDGREDLWLPPGVQVALAYVAAVPKKHEARLAQAHSFFLDLPLSELAGCSGAQPACRRVERWCVDATEEDCRTVGLPCDEDGQCRPTVSEGNASIISRPSDAFAGLSQNVVVMWTRDGLPASSLWSRGLGLKRDLKPGYNLIELGEPRPDDDEQDSDSWCTNCGLNPEPDRADIDPIEAEALARYNAAHGTNYASIDEAYDVLHASGSDDETPYEDFEDELTRLELQIQVEQGIDIAELQGTRLIDDWHTPLVITVGFGSEPVI